MYFYRRVSTVSRTPRGIAKKPTKGPKRWGRLRYHRRCVNVKTGKLCRGRIRDLLPLNFRSFDSAAAHCVSHIQSDLANFERAKVI